MNRTIYDKARTMMNESNLPPHLWGQAVLTATYLINRSPSSSIDNKIPAKIKNAEFNLKKIKTFGCMAWVNVMPRGDKLSSRAIPARMVGYNINGYTLWDPNTDKIIVSRDVRFDESKISYENCKNKICIQEVNNENIIQHKIEDEHDKGMEHKDYSSEEKDISEPNVSENKVLKPSYVTKSGREVKQPDYLKTYDLYCLLSSENDPATYKEAIGQSAEWKTAIEKELNSLKHQETWIETELPKNKKAIDTKWIFKTKSDGTRKARIVARGFQQRTDEYV